MNVRSDSDSRFRRSARCSPARQRHCLCSAALPPGRDAGYSSGCWLRRRSCETGPQAVVGTVLHYQVSPLRNQKQEKNESHLVAACHSTHSETAKSDPKHSSCAHRPPAAAPAEQCAQRAPPAPAGTGGCRTAAATSRYYCCME